MTCILAQGQRAPVNATTHIPAFSAGFEDGVATLATYSCVVVIDLRAFSTSETPGDSQLEDEDDEDEEELYAALYALRYGDAIHNTLRRAFVPRQVTASECAYVGKCKDTTGALCKAKWQSKECTPDSANLVNGIANGCVNCDEDEDGSWCMPEGGGESCYCSSEKLA